jgi:glycosyltransferase involved in cell wall biosynthesis
MKIACIAASQVPSDTANSIQVMKVCQAFVQLGHEVVLLVPNVPGREVNLQEHYGLTESFPVEWLDTPARRFFPWKAVQRAHALGADLLYCWPLQSAVLGLLAGLPVAVELHDLPGGRFGRLWFRLFLVLPGRKRLLPITRALAQALNLPAAITRLAPDGVDLERYAALPDPRAARKALALPEAPTVLCTGHLYEGRGADLFLSLAERFPEVSFVWVGGRPVEVDAWRQKAAHLHNVTLTGFVPNGRIPGYQAAADVLLMPYAKVIATSSGGNTAEVCSPMKMFEYMATGRAIVTSDLPVLREVLDETMAVFCPPEAAEAWEQALRSLLNDPRKREVLGQRARVAVEPYTWIERARRTVEGII